MNMLYLREHDEPGANPEVEAFLQPYIKAGIVDFDYWTGPRHPGQTKIYNECSQVAREHHSWVAYIDLDEFMVVLDKCARVHLSQACPLRAMSHMWHWLRPYSTACLWRCVVECLCALLHAVNSKLVPV